MVFCLGWRNTRGLCQHLIVHRVSVLTGILPEGLGVLREELRGVAEVVEEDRPGIETTLWITSRATDQDFAIASLQALIVPWAGIPQDLGARIRGRTEPRLYNLHHNAEITAETAVALLFAAARRVVEADHGMRRGHWIGRMDDGQGVCLAGKGVVVLGFGAIGKHVARLLEAVGMDVVGVSRSGSEGSVPVAKLDEHLAQSNALIVCCPLTEETRGLIDARRLELLRPPRLLVNVGRGPVIEEGALFEACRSGLLFGAGIDTWYQYPEGRPAPVWPSEFPFHELPNVVMSPHRGGDADMTEDARVRELLALIRDLLLGRPRRFVDPHLGY